MKITKRGAPIAEQIWYGTCQACTSEAEAKRSELPVISDRDGELAIVSCPVCGVGSMVFYPRKKNG